MLLGTTAAIIHGAGLPLMMLIFGDMTDSFAEVGQFQNGTLPNITFTNMTNQSKYYLWFWFYWKLRKKTITKSDTTTYALVCLVWWEVEGSER